MPLVTVSAKLFGRKFVPFRVLSVVVAHLAVAQQAKWNAVVWSVRSTVFFVDDVMALN